ncbi:alanine racemase [Williamsia muralis]|uniref:alanine racemase n=1 Tax=Williamsia marianensis TaxID=85044 RepID=UPI000DE650F8|nr:alanine racemase [Williamsia marianensis]PVY31540.1 D-serine deaminase-like pyridoxal phosphate-dependent protein [Williamsia marianensis]
MTELGLDGAVMRPEWPWAAEPERYWRAIDQAVRDHGAPDGPVAVLELTALRHNVADLRARAGGVPIRIASKSLRVRSVISEILATDGFAGVLAYDVAEAHWLATEAAVTDVLVGYPTANAHAIAKLSTDPVAAERVTLLVDSVDHLDLIARAVPPGAADVRVAIDLDASYSSRLLGHIGVRRSPIRTAAQAKRLAHEVAARPGVRLVGVMSYEAQVAGVGDAIPRKRLRNKMITEMQRRSMAELIDRRGRVVDALRTIADLEFVNAGGTGSIEVTATDPAITDIAAGSGFFGGHLFDNYAYFKPAPAMSFGLSVVRVPARGIVTCLGGGWVASGPPARDRLPLPVWPAGLDYLPREAAGEVQTPLTGKAAQQMRVGDRVWMRHTKSGELSEHVNSILVVDGGKVVGELPTYRGEGKCFL